MFGIDDDARIQQPSLEVPIETVEKNLGGNGLGGLELLLSKNPANPWGPRNKAETR
jgi:hypothetical protein